MNQAQKKQISQLLKEISKRGSTEATIGYIAETNGMLHACEVFLYEYSKQDQDFEQWFQQLCQIHKVSQGSFLKEITRIVRLFDQQGTTDMSHEILGVTPDATPEDIKRAYRKLSIKYHPDTSSSKDPENSKKFIEITRAYHELTGKVEKNKAS